MATFLSVFSKKVTACSIPLAGPGYVSLYITNFVNLKPIAELTIPTHITAYFIGFCSTLILLACANK
jgi:hypothetical protein